MQDDADGRRLSDILYHRGIQGVLVGQLSSAEFVASFAWSRFTSVALGVGTVRPPIHLIEPDHFQAVQCAWDHAAQMGFQRIGLTHFDEPAALDFHERRAAFLDRQLQVPAARRVPVLAIKGFTGDLPARAKIQQDLRNWIRRYQVEAVLGFNDWIYWFLTHSGWQVPGQVAFISLCKTEKKPNYPGMRLPIEELGRRAVDWVDSLLRTGEHSVPAFPATMKIDMQWQP